MRNFHKIIIILSFLCMGSLTLFANDKEVNKLTEANFLEDGVCAEAMYNLGVYYFYGIGTEQNYKRSFKYFKLAADKGHTDAQYNLGELYYLGLGIDKNYKK